MSSGAAINEDREGTGGEHVLVAEVERMGVLAGHSKR